MPTGDGRPAGGTTRAAGNKTPRKVQWAAAQPAQMDDSTHALDEHGLDPEAFKSLTHALERHKSEPSVSKPETAAAPAVSTPSKANAPRIHYFPPPRARPDLPRIDTTSTSESVSGPNTGTTGTPSPPSEPFSHQVPGEHYIGSNETAGLPGTSNLENYANSAANQVVRAHTRKRGMFGLGARRKPKTKAKPAKAKGGEEKDRSGVRSRDYAEQNGDDTDIEREGESALLQRSMGGGGILGALLTLYDSQQTLSGMSTPARSSSFDDGPRRSRQMKRSRTRSESVSPDGSRSPVSPISSPKMKDGSRTYTANSSVASLFQPFKTHRPSAARNAGGVIGSLIASTANITGAAAPESSKLAPNVTRPGYHLSRYSLENTTTQPRVPAVAIERPKSTHFEHTRLVSDSPASQTPSPIPTPTSALGSSPPFPPQHQPATPAGLQLPSTPGGGKAKWTGVLKDFPFPTVSSIKSGYASSMRSYAGSVRGTTPTSTTEGGDEWIDSKWLPDEERRKERKRKEAKRRKAEVYITRHVAEIIQRQEFILKFTRAMMMFGGPSHRLQAQIQSTAKVLDLQLSCMYLPDVILISFDDSSTGTSNIKFLRQSSALDLDKLGDAYRMYWRVIHDKISVSEASQELDVLMQKKLTYSWWQLVIIGGFCSTAICTVSFGGSFLDAVVVWPLGALLVAVQLLSVRNELYSNVFEITIATLLSFLGAALASTRIICYSAVTSSAVVLILPGFIVLSGALEISSRNIVSGSVRLCYAVMYSLFLGFGLAIGAQAYEKMSGKAIIGPEDYTCAESHNPNGPWWQVTPSRWWAFLTVPTYSLFLSMRNHAPLHRKETLLLVLIACVGWTTNNFTGRKFKGQNDISAAVGAFAVGIVANLYGRFFKGNSFVVMITGILFQLPSGLGNGGLLTFASQQNAGSTTSYLSGFQTALQLISVAIGLTVGLGISLVVVHPIQSRKRAGGVFSL